VLKSIVLFPVRVARGIVSRIRRKPPQDEVRLPTRTDPDGPNRKPAPFDPAGIPPQSAAPKPAPAPAAAPRPAPAEPKPAPQAAKPAPAPSQPTPPASHPEPPKAEATKPEATKAEAPSADENGASKDADAPKGKGKKKSEPKKKKGEAEPPEPVAEAVKPAAKAISVRAEATPNPNAMKFQCSVMVIAKGSLSFNNAIAAKQNPLASAVFDVGGVRSVFAVKDFVTVTREDGVDWNMLSPRIEAAIREHLSE
jgi:hypothetical protein